MAKRSKDAAKQPLRVGFETLEPRALLTSVADWWGDVGQWTTPAWWSDETWWDEAVWVDPAVADGTPEEQLALEQGGLEEEAAEEDLAALAEPAADVPAAGTPEAEQTVESSPGSLIAEPGAMPSSEGEPPFAAEKLPSSLPEDSLPEDSLPEDSSGQVEEVLAVADGIHDDASDDPTPFDASVDTAPVVSDVEPRPLEAEATEEVFAVGESASDEEVDAGAVSAADANAVISVVAPPFVGFEPTVGDAAEAAPTAIRDADVESVLPKPFEQADRDVAESIAPVASIASAPVGAPAAAVVSGHSHIRESDAPVAAAAGRRLAFWAGLLLPGGWFGFGGPALEPGNVAESGLGTSGFATTQPAPGRPRGRLSHRRAG